MIKTGGEDEGASWEPRPEGTHGERVASVLLPLQLRIHTCVEPRGAASQDAHPFLAGSVTFSWRMPPLGGQWVRVPVKKQWKARFCLCLLSFKHFFPTYASLCLNEINVINQRIPEMSHTDFLVKQSVTEEGAGHLSLIRLWSISVYWKAPWKPILIPSSFVDLKSCRYFISRDSFFYSYYVTSFEKWGRGFSFIFTCPLDLLAGYSWAFWCLFNMFCLSMRRDSVGAALAHCLGRQHRDHSPHSLQPSRMQPGISAQLTRALLSPERSPWGSPFATLWSQERTLGIMTFGQALSSLLVHTGWNYQHPCIAGFRWAPRLGCPLRVGDAARPGGGGSVLESGRESLWRSARTRGSLFMFQCRWG